MKLDLILLVVILAFTLVGYFTGILRQILKVTCVIFSFILSGPVAKFVSGYFESEQIGPLSSSLFIRLGAWVGLYILLRVAAFYVNRAVGADSQGVLRPLNRRLGGLLGLLEGMAVVLVTLWALQIWVTDKQALLLPGVHGHAAEEVLAAWSRSSIGWWLASRYNPLIDYEIAAKLETLRKVIRRPDVLSAISKDRSVQALLNHPKVKTVMNDESLRGFLAERDYIAILRNPNFKAMMADREVQALMRNVRIFEILDRELAKRLRQKTRRRRLPPGRAIREARV